MTYQEQIIQSFEAYLNEAAPTLDKFERAGILNRVRTTLSQRDKQIVEEIDRRIKLLPEEVPSIITDTIRALEWLSDQGSNKALLDLKKFITES